MALPILAAVLVIGMVSGGAVLISAYWRDAVTKGYEKEMALSKDETTRAILEDDSIPDENRTQLLMEYLDKTVSSSFGDFGELAKYIPILVGGYVAAAVLGGKK